MSSYTATIAISDQEWAEIQRCVKETGNYVAEKKAEAERLRLEAALREEELQKKREQVEDSINDALRTLQSGFENAGQNLAKEAKQAFQKQKQSFDQEIGGLENDIVSTRKETAGVRTKIERISQIYTDMVKEAMDGQSNAAGKADVYLKNLDSLLAQIRELNPEQFLPDAYRILKQIATDAKSNVKAGNYQAAIMTSQISIQKATTLLTNLVSAKHEYESSLLEAQKAADDLKLRFDNLRPEMDGKISFEIEGESFEFEYDINHWSEGHFETLRDQFEAVWKQLHTEVEPSHLNALKVQISDLNRQLTRCDQAARQELLGSLNAQETAARVCDSLAGKWDLETHGFDREDDRNPYTMIYKDGAGNTISVVVSPGMSADKPDIFIEAFTGDETREEIIKQDAQVSMAGQGICIERVEHHKDCANYQDGEDFIKNTVPTAIAANQARRRRSFGTH